MTTEPEKRAVGALVELLKQCLAHAFAEFESDDLFQITRFAGIVIETNHDSKTYFRWRVSQDDGRIGPSSSVRLLRRDAVEDIVLEVLRRLNLASTGPVVSPVPSSQQPVVGRLKSEGALPGAEEPDAFSPGDSVLNHGTVLCGSVVDGYAVNVRGVNVFCQRYHMAPK